MTWGGLNPALTSWRNGILARFPRRGRQSDGGYADKVHGSRSEHQPDPDGSVDAYDSDVNYLGSARPAGNAMERRICEALKADFENDPHGRGQLWIHQREIANADIGDWRERPYTNGSPHDLHIHFQSRQSREHDGRPWPMPRTDALLRELEEDDMKMDDEDRKWFQQQLAAQLADAAGETWTGLHLKALSGIVDTDGKQTPMDVLHRIWNRVALLPQVLTLLQTIATRDDVDEQALAAALGPAVGTYVLAHLPAGADQVSQDEVNEAVRAAFRDAFSADHA
jgi:hypothetical protein